MARVTRDRSELQCSTCGTSFHVILSLKSSSFCSRSFCHERLQSGRLFFSRSICPSLEFTLPRLLLCTFAWYIADFHWETSINRLNNSDTALWDMPPPMYSPVGYSSRCYLSETTYTSVSIGRNPAGVWCRHRHIPVPCRRPKLVIAWHAREVLCVSHLRQEAM